MLSLNLKPGEYMTVGGNVVVQLDRINGDRCKLLIDAPKELTILRGEVLERTGGQRRRACTSPSPPSIWPRRFRMASSAWALLRFQGISRRCQRGVSNTQSGR